MSTKARRRKPKNLVGKNGMIVRIQSRFDFIEVFDSYLYPKAARALAKRLVEMAEWLEAKQ